MRRWKSHIDFSGKMSIWTYFKKKKRHKNRWWKFSDVYWEPCSLKQRTFLFHSSGDQLWESASLSENWGICRAVMPPAEALDLSLPDSRGCRYPLICGHSPLILTSISRMFFTSFKSLSPVPPPVTNKTLEYHPPIQRRKFCLLW